MPVPKHRAHVSAYSAQYSNARTGSGHARSSHHSHAQHITQEDDWPGLLLRIDESRPPGFSLAKKAVAFLRFLAPSVTSDSPTRVQGSVAVRSVACPCPCPERLLSHDRPVPPSNAQLTRPSLLNFAQRPYHDSHAPPRRPLLALIPNCETYVFVSLFTSLRSSI